MNKSPRQFITEVESYDIYVSEFEEFIFNPDLFIKRNIRFPSQQSFLVVSEAPTTCRRLSKFCNRTLFLDTERLIRVNKFKRAICLLFSVLFLLLVLLIKFGRRRSKFELCVILLKFFFGHQ